MADVQDESKSASDGAAGKTKDVIDAVTGLVKAVPIYEDLARPAAKQLGKSLETVAKTVNMALAPVGLMIWGYEQIQEFVSGKVAERLKNVPPEAIIQPELNIAGPALEALRYTGHSESLSDMYANLLAGAMDASTASQAHPAFVEIIKQLTSDEAKLMKLFVNKKIHPILTVLESKANVGTREQLVYFSTFANSAGIANLDNLPSYFNNLCRLGLTEIPEGMYLSEGNPYEELESEPIVKQNISVINRMPDTKAEIKKLIIRPSQLGQQFLRACVQSKV
ncbi:MULTISPECIES: DUF4393 domain-containing protein [Pseudomonas]|uniref:DUF4393 domain-containing protein n=1 Tax=Pseudomonas TaxID=286 RepID=UPI000B353343|nr:MULTISPECIES: DUF4393 domain-containing protein [Pseudomonas]PMY52264.1 DUF4393 domain-containing protein [Pseudomonas sp. FW305-53]PMY85117.1 DUF4393 domain-containing protein [Pseudomonas sp. FW303-C2]PMY91174.1 DUF4393 domain-containing protein [Pseudomonas sp. FW305-62]PNA40226.1 DUF4393 domain-containing protein [Pseudomonas sp. FW306-2-2C-A10BC]PNA89628.1 DUF4393 domain-containing protein [Pseudomonas sp. MPR-R3B]